MKPTRFSLCGLSIALLASAVLLPKAHAITITHGGDSVDIEFVDIGNGGNAGHTYTDFYGNTVTHGSVAYNYSIGKFEVTSDQWATVTGFDNLIENNSNDSWSDQWSGSQPTARASWYEAAKFANWLTSGDALQGAYQFSDATTFTGVDRNTALSTYGTVYVLPTEDEWHKAAFFKSDGSGYTVYATGDTAPDGIDFDGDTTYDSVYRDGYTLYTPYSVGGGTVENNGTYDMAGNVWEWNESAFDGDLNDPGESRVIRGGGMSSHAVFTQWIGRDFEAPDSELFLDLGFRVAAIDIVDIGAVPEPSSVGLLAIGAMGCVLRRKR